ncbi:MAG TPA: hypothetical protein VN911_18640 [Candidatus Acidoferrum sp.]|nr:hypothetical protein [Candidatus Acidoferrum sp.]
MKTAWFAIVLLAGSFLLAQESYPANNNRQEVKDSNGQVTVRGCVSRSSGDYTLIKQNPPMTYELQGSHGVKLRNYLGQRVEVTGTESPTMSSSSDAMNKTGSAAPTTITVSSIRTIDKDCPQR